MPSFKLKSKTRDGARVHKVYFAPATPCERLIAHASVSAIIKKKLAAQFLELDPVRLLQQIRDAVLQVEVENPGRCARAQGLLRAGDAVREADCSRQRQRDHQEKARCAIPRARSCSSTSTDPRCRPSS